MNLHLVDLKRDCMDFELFEAINAEAFPPSEYMPMEDIFTFAENTDSHVLGIYDDRCPIGFMLFVKNANCGYVFFFAIGKKFRSKGYGSSALKALAEKYRKLQIILDFEQIDENAENNSWRIRRKQFYLRNGFCETNRYTLLRGERFEVVCTKGDLRCDDFKEIIAVIHSQCPDFPNVLI